MDRVIVTEDDSIDGYIITKRIGEIRYVYRPEPSSSNFAGNLIASSMASRHMKAKAISMGGNAVIRFRMKKTDQIYPGSTRVERAYPFPSPLDYTPGGRRIVRTPGYKRTEYTFSGYVVLIKEKATTQAATPKAAGMKGLPKKKKFRTISDTDRRREDLLYCHICGLPFKRETDLKRHLDNWHR